VGRRGKQPVVWYNLYYKGQFQGSYFIPRDELKDEVVCFNIGDSLFNDLADDPEHEVRIKLGYLSKRQIEEAGEFQGF